MNASPPRQELDKFQAATIKLIDTLHGYFLGNHAISIIDDARSICELISGFTKHLKDQGKIDPNLELIYNLKSKPGDQNLSPLKRKQKKLTIAMRLASQKRSNYAKHADKDADKTLSYDRGLDILHLLYSMVGDYALLHSELIQKGLLDQSQEKLYPIKRSLLWDHGYQYRSIYYFSNQNHWQPKLEDSTSGIFKIFKFSSSSVQEFPPPPQGDIHVPAAAAACILFYRSAFGTESDLARKRIVAQEMEDLGIFPVNEQTNARVKRDPSQDNKLEL